MPQLDTLLYQRAAVSAHGWKRLVSDSLKRPELSFRDVLNRVVTILSVFWDNTMKLIPFEVRAVTSVVQPVSTQQ